MLPGFPVILCHNSYWSLRSNYDLDASPWGFLFFSYSTKVVMLGNAAASLEIGDLPILTADMRATFQYAAMRRAVLTWRPTSRDGSGTALAYQLLRVNGAALGALVLLSVAAGLSFYLPPFFMSRVLQHLEADPHRENTGWGWVWVVCLFSSNFALFTRTSLVCSYPCKY